MVQIRCIMLILSLTTVPKSYGLNALFVSIAGAGHVTPMFELAKTMKDHNITFLTHRVSELYVNIKSSSSSAFRTIYANDSPDALIYEKSQEEKMISSAANNTFFDAFPKTAPIIGAAIIEILEKMIHILTTERFDVIVAGKFVSGAPIVSARANIPCVIVSPSATPNMLGINVPNTFSLLSTKDITQFTYRIYNVAYGIRLMIEVLPKFSPALYKIFQSMPQIPGPFQDVFSLSNLLSSKSKCLTLNVLAPTFDPIPRPDPYVKFLGAFIDDNSYDEIDNDLTKWIKSKPTKSIIYAAFGSTSIIKMDRMRDLIHGLASFLLGIDDSHLILAFRKINYETYHSVLNQFDDDRLKTILSNKQRVKVENGFVQQKWILKQNSIKIFLSHCGMNSILESLYFGKPILCMPFGMEQFSNAITIVHRGIGKSLFTPPSLWDSFIDPYNFVNYTFDSRKVTENILSLWTDSTYETATAQMSLDIKYAGGLKRAIAEIELFVQLKGDYDRFIPFEDTLPFFQRYMIDLVFIFIILPGILNFYIFYKCCIQRRQHRKQKKD